MTGFDTGTTTVPAGWYPDPQGPPLQRWWDGSAWTQHTNDPRPTPVSIPDPTVQPTATAEALPAYVPMREFGGASYTRQATNEPVHGSSLNVWIWLIAAMPLLQGIVGLVVLLALNDLPGGVIRYAVLIGPLAAYFYFAKRDAAALRDAGHRPVGWGWILLPLVYFILRTVRAGKETLAPLLTTLALQLLLMVLSLAVLIPVYLHERAEQNRDTYGTDTAQTLTPLTPDERAYQLTAAGMSERLLSDLTAGGTDVTYANCAEPTSLAVGTEVLCATDLSGASTVIVVTIQPDDPYVPFYVTGVAH